MFTLQFAALVASFLSMVFTLVLAFALVANGALAIALATILVGFSFVAFLAYVAETSV